MAAKKTPRQLENIHRRARRAVQNGIRQRAIELLCNGGYDEQARAIAKSECSLADRVMGQLEQHFTIRDRRR